MANSYDYEIPGIYVRAQFRDYISNEAISRYKIGKAGLSVKSRLKDQETGDTYPCRPFRIYGCDPNDASEIDKLIRVHFEPFRVREEGLGKETFELSLNQLDAFVKHIPRLTTSYAYRHPRDDNREWPDYVKLALYLNVQAEAPGQKYLSDSGALAPIVMGNLKETFPEELEALTVGRHDGGISAMCQRYGRMFTKNYENEHPSKWPDLAVHEQTVWESGWTHYPLDYLL